MKKIYIPKISFFSVVSIIVFATFFMLLSLIGLDVLFNSFDYLLNELEDIFKLLFMVIIGLISYLGFSYIFRLFKYLK